MMMDKGAEADPVDHSALYFFVYIWKDGYGLLTMVTFFSVK